MNNYCFLVQPNLFTTYLVWAWHQASAGNNKNEISSSSFSDWNLKASHFIQKKKSTHTQEHNHIFACVCVKFSSRIHSQLIMWCFQGEKLGVEERFIITYLFIPFEFNPMNVLFVQKLRLSLYWKNTFPLLLDKNLLNTNRSNREEQYCRDP